MALKNAFENLATESKQAELATPIKRIDQTLLATPFVYVVNQSETIFDTSALSKETTLQEVLTELQAINVNTNELEATLTSIDFNTDEIEQALINLYTELGEKLEAGELTGLATAANQLLLATPLISIDKTLLSTPYVHVENLRGDVPTRPSYTQEISPLDISALALDSTLRNRFGGGTTPVVATVTASGDTVVHTPTSGNAIRLLWVSAVNDPDQEQTPLVKIKIGTTEYYRVYATAHWEPFEGEADEQLIVNLSGTGSVAFTAHIAEFAP